MESKKRVVFEWGQAEAKMRLLNDGTVEFSMPPITDGWHYWRKDTSSEELARMKMQYEPPEPEVIFETDTLKRAFGAAVRVFEDGSAEWVGSYDTEVDNRVTETVYPNMYSICQELARLWRIVHERE